MASLLAANAPDSGQWLHANPVPSLGTNLDAEQIRIGIALLIGARIYAKRVDVSAGNPSNPQAYTVRLAYSTEGNTNDTHQ